MFWLIGSLISPVINVATTNSRAIFSCSGRDGDYEMDWMVNEVVVTTNEPNIMITFDIPSGVGRFELENVTENNNESRIQCEVRFANGSSVTTEGLLLVQGLSIHICL